MDISRQKLDEIIGKLAAFGEDAEELGYWQSIYDDLADAEKEKLLENLALELEELQKVV